MLFMTVGRRRGYFLVLTMILNLGTAPGCGDGKPYVDTSLNEATVTGLVSANGVPATAGTIHFNPSNSGRIVATRSAEIGPDGKYTIKTYTGDNQVTYSGELAKKNPGVGLRRDFATVQAGENNFDFDVLGAGGKSLNFDVTKAKQRKKR
jgi:hypothetical protein